MGQIYVPVAGETTRGPSPLLWQSCPLEEILITNPGRGYHYWDDFLDTPSMGTAGSAIATTRYSTYMDTGNTMAGRADVVGGVYRLALDATDNDEAWISLSGAGAPFVFSRTAGAERKLWFEARVRLQHITDVRGFYIGMSEESLAAADTITDAGALADKDFLGFHGPEGDGDTVDWVYRTAGQAVQTKIDAISSATALAASTWVKLGMVWDPDAVAAERIACFFNGAKQSTFITDTNMAAATFPNGEEMTFLMGIKNASAAATWMDIDWVRIAQLSV